MAVMPIRPRTISIIIWRRIYKDLEDGVNYNLEHQIQLIQEDQGKGNRSWELQEVDTDGKTVCKSLVPWPWSIYFVATDLEYSKTIEIDENADTPEERVLDTQYITGNLKSGRNSDGSPWVDIASYTMLGTSRELENLRLCIRTVRDGESENCLISGWTSYEDSEKNVTDDTLLIELALSEDCFSETLGMLQSNHIDSLEIRLGGVSGFYAERSPLITTSRIKVLTQEVRAQLIQEINNLSHDEMREVKLPRLGRVGEFSMYLTQRTNNLTHFRLFGGSKKNGLVNESEAASIALLEKLSENERTLKKLRLPIWGILILLVSIFFF